MQQVLSRTKRRSLWLSSAIAMRRTGKGTTFVDSASAKHDDGHHHWPDGFSDDDDDDDDEDFDADETFRNFSGGMPQATRMQWNVDFNILTLIHILPVVILLLISFRPSPSPVCMMSHSHPSDL